MSSRNEAEPLLRVRGLHKRYASPVLVDVAIDLWRGEVHALVGGNGAGKSTLSRIFCGLTFPDAGTMELAGGPYAPRTRREAENAGVQIVMQELVLIPTLSIAENIFLEDLPRRFGFIDYPTLNARAGEALAAAGLGHLDPEVRVGELGVGQRQLVEIAAALAHPCRLLILDEPTAALTDPEIDLLFEHVRRLRGQGVGILYISHRMDEILRISDRVTVLRDGRIVESQLSGTLTVDEILRQMTGTTDVRVPHSCTKVAGDVALRVQGLCRGDAFRDVSFEVRRGEIFGLAGLVGSGRTETLRAIFGADKPSAGNVWRSGNSTPVRIDHPRDAVRAGIGMIPEDRKDQGLLLPQSVKVNTTLASLNAVRTPGGWIDRKNEAGMAGRFIERLGVRAESDGQPVIELSGGNQQKVLIARWLVRNCEVLLFDEPTRGVDAAAKHAIHELLHELAAEGRALVVVSSELPELMAICDRIGVLSAGRLAATFERGAWSEDLIMAAAISGYRDAAVLPRHD